MSSGAWEDMEKFMEARIFLQTWVKENWRDNVSLIHSFGYRED